MIVKDEEPSIGVALDSLHGLVDEIVVVDTGSTDKTVDILKSHGANVIEGGDRMHKGAMRNLAQEYTSEDADWIVFLDGDEELEDAAGLRTYLETTPAEAIYLTAIRHHGNGAAGSQQQQMRCWRKGLVAYKYRAHEVPECTNGRPLKTAYTEYAFHNRPRQREGGQQYTLDRLLLDVQEHPTAARPLFYLGRQWYYMKRWRKARDVLEQYVNDFPAGWDAADAYYYLSHCYQHEGEIGEAITALYKAVALRPRRRDFWGRLGTIYYNRESYDLAAAMLCAALEMHPPTTGYRMPEWYGAHIQDLLARCYWKLGEMEVGQIHAEKAVELEPDNKRLIDNLAFFETGGGD